MYSKKNALLSTRLPLHDGEYPELVWFNFRANYGGSPISVPIKATTFNQAKCRLLRLLTGGNHKSVSPQLYAKTVISVHVAKITNPCAVAAFLIQHI